MMPESQAPAARALTPRMAAALAAWEASGGDYARMTEILGVDRATAQNRVSYLRRIRVLPPGEKGRPTGRDPDAVPSVVVAAAERLLAGRPRRWDWAVVGAWDGWLDESLGQRAAAGRAMARHRTGGGG